MSADVKLDEVMTLAMHLSALDKVRLIEGLVPQIEQDVIALRPTPLRSLLGLCADLGPVPSPQDIDAVRREACTSFPREDV